MSKFKIGDKVRVVKNTGIEFDNAKIGDIGVVREIHNSTTYPIYVKMDEKEEIYDSFNEDELELYLEEVVMKKTFRELIADGINKGEIWENKENRVKRIYINDDNNLTFEGDDCTFSINYSTCIGLDDVYELKRKEYNFLDAFYEYEKGDVEIESYRHRYKKINGKDAYYSDVINDWRICNEFGFDLKEIRGRWYING